MENTNSDKSSGKKGALSELRVIDATQMLAGPIAGTRLGDLGADVIKVEPPASGEFNRTRGFEDQQSNGEMTTFLAVNRNKRSLAIDLKSAGGLEVIYELVKKSDFYQAAKKLSREKRNNVLPCSLKLESCIDIQIMNCKLMPLM